jgi:hypothetical protein
MAEDVRSAEAVIDNVFQFKSCTVMRQRPQQLAHFSVTIFPKAGPRRNRRSDLRRRVHAGFVEELLNLDSIRRVGAQLVRQ